MTSQRMARRRVASGRMEMGITTALMLLVRPPVALFSYLFIGPAFALGPTVLGGMAGGHFGFAAAAMVDAATYLALLVAGATATITGRAQRVAALFAVLNGWYFACVLFAALYLTVLELSDGTVPTGRNLAYLGLAVLAATLNTVTFWLPVRVLRRARAHEDADLLAQWFPPSASATPMASAPATPKDGPSQAASR